MANRVSVWILGDQLVERHPALAEAEKGYHRDNIRVVMVESARRTRRLPYHRKKLVLLFSAMRHYARELEGRGFQVDYVRSASTLAGLIEHLESWQPAAFYCMAASEYAGRRFQEQVLPDHLTQPITILPNTQFLIGQYDPYPEPVANKRYTMEHFYRAMRKHFKVLVDEAGNPTGGSWNFDKDNRKPLPKDITVPKPPTFGPDAITAEVMEEVAAMPAGTGTVDGFDLAVERESARASFDDFLTHRLENFGPYEDAMSQDHAILFHSAISPYLNLGLLEPMNLIRRVAEVYEDGGAPINSVEGFIRQVMGWREYIYWQYWRVGPGFGELNFWQAERRLPEFFWTAETDLHCLQQVLQRVSQTGYSHHIERLMVLSNFCLLAGIQPQEVNAWFLASFIDAYEWVMAPNVLGMGLHADGGLTGTKPYIASANYINKMSNYCDSCRYQPKVRTGPQACPFNFLYWNFLIANEEILRANPRMGPNVLGLRYLDGSERQRVQSQAGEFLNSMA